jgi:hypothetical protein
MNLKYIIAYAQIAENNEVNNNNMWRQTLDTKSISIAYAELTVHHEQWDTNPKNVEIKIEDALGIDFTSQCKHGTKNGGEEDQATKRK